MVLVYPVPGRFLLGVPAAPQSVPKADAERLVASGAFTEDPPPSPADAEPPESTES